MAHSRSLKVCPVKLIDLRSDTVTRPSLAMRQVMANAEVGDDMLGEDPTVNRLEKMVAEMFGREAAVFACSGTQSNQMGVRVHCVPGDELLINETGHISLFEGGAPAALSGVTVRTIAAEGGFWISPIWKDAFEVTTSIFLGHGYFVWRTQQTSVAAESIRWISCSEFRSGPWPMD
jgi:hypothetical protein